MNRLAHHLRGQDTAGDSTISIDSGAVAERSPAVRLRFVVLMIPLDMLCHDINSSLYLNI
jgi:hypothetical protein